MARAITAVAVEGLPEIRPGDDLPELIAGALARQRETLQPGDVLVMAHKIVSKAEGRIRRLADVEPGPRALELGEALGKDPRHVQVVLDESQAVRRASQGVLICVTHHGFVCANAGVDASNVPGEDTLVLLPKDPDASARRLRRDLTEPSRNRAGGRDHRLLRPGLAPRPGRHRDRLRRP